MRLRLLSTTVFGLALSAAIGCSSSAGPRSSGPSMPWSKKSKDNGFNEYTKAYQERSMVAPGIGMSDEKTGWDKFAHKMKPSSIGQSISNGYNSTKNKLASWGSNDDEALDPISLANTPSEPTPSIYVATAQLHEQRNNVQAAVDQYVRALEVDPQDRDALLGYAHLLDRTSQFEEARVYYERAAKAHPMDATTVNDLGIFYARRNMYNESLAALERSVELEPTRVLYRNNVATVLVEMNRNDEALNHLAAVHGEPIAHYNLGHLLVKRGNNAAAREQFALALQQDPAFGEARAWLAHLGAQQPLSGTARHQIARAPTGGGATASDTPRWANQSSVDALPAPPSSAARPGVDAPTQATAPATAEQGPSWPAQARATGPAAAPSPDDVRNMTATTDPAEVEVQARAAMRPLPSLDSSYYPPSRY